MLSFEIHKNGEFLSRHTAKDEAEQAKIVETIRFAHGKGILSKKDGIAVVEVKPKAVETVFVSVASAPKGYRPPPKPKRADTVPQRERNDGANLGDLFRKAGIR